MPDTDELLTPEEVAKRLSVSIRSVRRFADTGQLVPIRAARHLAENFFCKLKQFRAIATRYDKTKRNFLAAIQLVASAITLN
jgi:transposase